MGRVSMTQESTEKQKTEVVTAEIVSEEEGLISFDDKARALLPDSEYLDLVTYIEKGKPELALSTANSFFELYMNGVDVDEIHQLNPAFPKSLIHWTRIKYDWDLMLKEHIFKLQQRISDKVLKAQLEATSLYADVITAANKKHSVNLKKYIQTGDETYLKKTLDITSIHQLQKAVEGLQKVTGQDKNFRITKEENINVSLDMKGLNGEALSPESASKILSVVAEENRKRDLEKQKG